MEELSIEEKAKRYDEALKYAKIYYTSGDEDMKMMMKTCFPVLVEESEDEMIRKEIITYLSTSDDKEIIPYESWISWLEKQGEKKADEEIEPTPIFRIGDVIKRKGKDYTFRVDRIQGGYYHCDRNYGAYFPIEDQDNWELVEQNPEWTPMDEQRVENILSIIEGHGYPGEVAWLNSLKDRVQPQPKQEWNDEDAKALNRISEILVDASEVKNWWKEYRLIERDEMIRLTNFLKSLKERVQPKQEWSEEDEYVYNEILKRVANKKLYEHDLEYIYKWLKSLRPQSTWKPSDAQINALYDVLNPCDGIDKEVLGSLYNDIKKLREE